MPHWRLLFPSNYLCAADLREQPVEVTIEDVSVEELVSVNGGKTKKEKKVIISFKGKSKKLVANRTNAKAIAKQLGPKTEDWVGQTVTLYPTTCMAFGERVECVRVKEKK